MESVTISHWNAPEDTDEMMEEARQKVMPLILATGADSVQLVCTGDSSVSVVTDFPDEELGKAAMDKIGAVREQAAEHFAMTLNSAHAEACLSSQVIQRCFKHQKTISKFLEVEVRALAPFVRDGAHQHTCGCFMCSRPSLHRDEA